MNNRCLNRKKRSFEESIRGFEFTHSNSNGVFYVVIVRVKKWLQCEDHSLKIICDILLSNKGSVLGEITKASLSLFVDVNFFNANDVFNKNMIKIIYDEQNECFIVSDISIGQSLLINI